MRFATFLHTPARALSATVITWSCAPQTTVRPNVIVYGTPNQPNTLDPITAPDIVSRSMIEMIFDGLVSADDKSQIHGDSGDQLGSLSRRQGVDIRPAPRSAMA